MNLQNKTIKNQEILIDDISVFNAIGSDVILKNCTVKCLVPANSLGIRGTLIDTTPLWPNFTILNPKENLADLHKVMDKDEIIEDIVDSIEFFDKELGAITFDAKQLGKELGVKTDEIKKNIASFNFIKS